MVTTVFKNIFDKQPFKSTVDICLERIKNGSSAKMIADIRTAVNKERADKLKQNLPCVLFSGTFTSRNDAAIVKHSGFIVLDFDNVAHIDEKMAQVVSKDFIYACWLSPRGNGVKALALIADGKQHREHFAAIKDIFPDIDSTGQNEARVCYESYDPNIYINKNATPLKKAKKVEFVQSTEKVGDGVFSKLVSWLANKGDAFVTGQRNQFVFKLAAACCRFGISEFEATSNIIANYGTESTFTQSEAHRAIKSAYRANQNKSGTASFEKDVLVERSTKYEVAIEPWIDDEGKVKDIIYGEFVKEKALSIYTSGYEKVLGMGVPEFDALWKPKRAEITCLTGIGNYGKSSLLKFILLMRAILYGEKYALFSPEDNPPQEFYHDLTEILLGADCTPKNPRRPSRDSYNAAYDFVSKHIFYLYPKNVAPTPAYIKEKFLEMIITEGIVGNVIDPFNQMHNDYHGAGGRSDKYLETFLSDYSRFNQENDQYGIIVAHPHKMQKQQDGNYPCPDVFDLADGAMWNNKMDNIIVYHRPLAQKEPDNPMCEFHSKKIRRQKIVGIKGYIDFEMHRPIRRFRFSGVDVMAKALASKGLNFEYEQAQIFHEPIKQQSSRIASGTSYTDYRSPLPKEIEDVNF